jgi:hypothetical protein
MRPGWALLLAPFLLAGCAGGPNAPGSAAPPPAPPTMLPPSLLVDLGANASAGDPPSLQVYVHAKNGNVRYDFLNLTERNDAPAGDPSLLTWRERVTGRERAYALDEDLDRQHANLSLEAVAGAAKWSWSGNLTLVTTASPPLLRLAFLDPARGWQEPVNVTLPYETLLAPEGP